MALSGGRPGGPGGAPADLHNPTMMLQPPKLYPVGSRECPADVSSSSKPSGLLRALQCSEGASESMITPS